MMPAGRPAITGMHSQGIIDDIFEGAGKKVVHAVRRTVQDAVHADKRLAGRTAAAAKSKTRSEISNAKKIGGVKKGFAKEVGIKTGPDGKPLKGPDGKTIRVKPKIRTANPTKKATKAANKSNSAKANIDDINSRVPKKTAARAEAYSSIRDNKMFRARAFFPDDASFQRALKEEAADIRRATKGIKGGPKVTKKKK
jgi:hypothetical protein